MRDTGRRASTTYSITRKGRAALKRWLLEPGGPPSLEFEALLKVAFADATDIGALRAQLAHIRRMLDDRRDYVRTRISEYEQTGGPFPERLHVIALVARFQQEQLEAMRRWVRWAEEQVNGWEGVTRDTGAKVPRLRA